MKTIITFIAFSIISAFVSGCTTGVGASVGHDGRSHGIHAKGSTANGVSGNVRAY